MGTEAIEGRIREIRAASYGKEVREPIAEVLEEISMKIAEETEDWKTATEVIDARGPFSTIGSRIDTQKVAFDTDDLYTKLDEAADLIKKRQENKEEKEENA